MNSFLHVFHALEPSPSSAATARKSYVTSQSKNEAPSVDAGTAGVDVSQYRQAIYGYERLIEQLYDLARAERYDELHDAIRAKYLVIHGPL